jgi:hypothetical protein
MNAVDDLPDFLTKRGRYQEVDMEVRLADLKA